MIRETRAVETTGDFNLGDILKVLMIGDVVGKGGRRTLSNLLPNLIKELDIDFVIAQGENSAGGFGITRKTSEEFFKSGVDVITSGNHIWDKPDILKSLIR